MGQAKENLARGGNLAVEKCSSNVSRTRRRRGRENVARSTILLIVILYSLYLSVPSTHNYHIQAHIDVILLLLLYTFIRTACVPPRRLSRT